ncbi:hypothetical protein QEM13_003890 [Pseudomonas putida]|uniref:hypothetical protein n=1 Tax=Pseudomonas sp. p1(2021b) TaxID=2874628 RepID=UPI001CCC12E8|nr:hypothetical protein [Pseudomonas sp. p1(2021b)]EKT4524580.1 hypothetical protein [Pseudomonas putida]UBM26374.1 hypothetical protein K8374_05105 [Pseudomonas sp. p1(2021b)]
MQQTDSISPLAIIAIFAGIIEASALASLPFLSENSQKTYTWFLVGFPFFLTMLFFLTLNFNYHSLYQPNKSAGRNKIDAAPSAPPMESPNASTMIITLSGPETRKIIEHHILRTLTRPQPRTRRWVLENLDTRTRIHLSIGALSETEKK